MCKNDTGVLCLLLKLGIIKKYECANAKCKVGNTWNSKPIQLLLNRKNGINDDLTISNLELLCANCYMVNYGLELFKKTVKETIYMCKLCGFPMNKFSNSKKKQGYCMSCENRIIKSTFYTTQNEYITKLNDTIDDKSPLKKNEFTTSKYFSEINKFKSLKNVTDRESINDSGTKEDKSIIKLNMSIPDISELIDL